MVVPTNAVAFPPPRPPTGAAAPAQPPRSPCVDGREQRFPAAAPALASAPRAALCPLVLCVLLLVCRCASLLVYACAFVCARSCRPLECASLPHVPSLGCGRIDSEKLHGRLRSPSLVVLSCALRAARAAGRVPKRRCDCAALPLIVSAFGISAGCDVSRVNQHGSLPPGSPARSGSAACALPPVACWASRSRDASRD
jgi:hypothetical protein